MSSFSFSATFREKMESMHERLLKFDWDRTCDWTTNYAVKVKNDHQSKFSNLSNWKEEAWKKLGFQWDSSPRPPIEQWNHTGGEVN